MKTAQVLFVALIITAVGALMAQIQPATSACAGSRGSVCTVTQTACLKTMALAKATPSVIVAPAASPMAFSAPMTLFISCPTQPNCGALCPGGGATPTSASLAASLLPFPCPQPPPPPLTTSSISTANGTMTLPRCAPTASGFNSYVVPLSIPAGTPAGTYCITGVATVSFSDGTALRATGDQVMCLVESAPGQPGRPRLDVQLTTPAFPRLAPGDQAIAEYLVTNRDRSQSVTLTAIADAQQIAIRPRGANERQGVFAIAHPFGDDFPIAFEPPGCIPLPGHPYTQNPIRRTLGTLAAGESRIVRVGIRSSGECASGSCAESTLRVQGDFADGTPTAACAGMALLTDTSAPTRDCGFQENDCNANGIADADDIANSRSQDLNFNATPDECERGAPAITGPLQVSPQVALPGQMIRVVVPARDDVGVARVWANGTPLTNRGDGIWEGDIPADGEAGQQTVYALARDNDGQIATHIGLYQTAGPAILRVSPSALTFNAVVGQGNPPAQLITVQNSGSGVLNFSIASSDPGLVSVAPSTGTLGSGQSAAATVFVTNPQVAGSRHATLTISAPGAQNSPQFVSMTVNTTAPPPPAVLNVSPGLLTFNTVVGQSNPPPQTITVQNIGGGSLSFSIVSSDFGLATTSISSGTLVGGQSTSIQVLVANPNSVGTRSATLTISAPGAQNSPRFVSITVNTAPSPARLNVTPTSLTFSAVVGQGNPSPQTLSAQNTGGSVLSFDITSSDPGLVSVSPGSSTLFAGQSTTVTVFVTNPQAAGTRNATLTISAPGAQNSPQFVSITVNTSGPPPALRVTPTSLVFNAMVGQGDPLPQAIAVSNIGGGILFFNIISSDPSLVNVSPRNGVLFPGQAVNVQVFVTNPQTAGFRTALLTVNAPGAQGSPQIVNVTVNTTSGPVCIFEAPPGSPQGYDFNTSFPDVMLGGSTTENGLVRIFNIGGQDLIVNLGRQRPVSSNPAFQVISMAGRPIRPDRPAPELVVRPGSFIDAVIEFTGLELGQQVGDIQFFTNEAGSTGSLPCVLRNVNGTVVQLDPNEPNDSPQQATFIPTPTLGQSASISGDATPDDPGADVLQLTQECGLSEGHIPDWFRFIVSPRGAFQMSLEFASSDVDYALWVFRGTGNLPGFPQGIQLVTFSFADVGQPEFIASTVLEPGTYFIGVSRQRRFDGSDATRPTYTLTLTNGASPENHAIEDAACASFFGPESDVNELIVVNRIRPTQYPARLDSISALLLVHPNQPSPHGRFMRMIAFHDPSGRGAPPFNPPLLVDQPVLVNLNFEGGAYVTLPLGVEGPVIFSGDFYVGYVVDTPRGIFPDMGRALLSGLRTFASADGGQTYQVFNLQDGSGQLFNVVIRAGVNTAPFSKTSESSPAPRLAVKNAIPIDRLQFSLTDSLP
jgi:hypothetical protein